MGGSATSGRAGAVGRPSISARARADPHAKAFAAPRSAKSAHTRACVPETHPRTAGAAAPAAAAARQGPPAPPVGCPRPPPAAAPAPRREAAPGAGGGGRRKVVQQQREGANGGHSEGRGAAGGHGSARERSGLAPRGRQAAARLGRAACRGPRPRQGAATRRPQGTRALAPTGICCPSAPKRCSSSEPAMPACAAAADA